MNDSSTGQRSRQVLPTGGRDNRLPVGTVCRRSGFTLIELLVVIGIIVILIGILIPAIGYVRTAARAASTQSLLAELQGAIERYQMDFRAYPGPLNNDMMYVAVSALPVGNANHVTGVAGRVTGSENLVLALLGGLGFDDTMGGTGVSKIRYAASLVGTGPRTLAYDFANGVATGKTNQAKSAYLESVADISTNSVNNDTSLPANSGHFKDGVGEADDSTIPEFVDRFSSPMPILYLRARVGAPNTTAGPTGPPVIIGDAANVRRGDNGASTGQAAQYDINQYFGYVGSFTGSWQAGTIAAVTLDADDRPKMSGNSIGEGKDIEYWYGPLGGGTAASGPFSVEDEINSGRGARHGLVAMMPYPAGNVGDLNVDYPITAPGYFRNPAFGTAGAPSNQDQPRGKDTYILISAGPDRVYGTKDDITSFGAVMP